MRMMFIVMMALILGGNFYVVYRLWHMMPAGSPFRWVLLGAAVFMISALFVSILAGGSLPSPVTKFLYKVGTAWVFIFLYLLIVLLLADLVRVTNLFSLRPYLSGNWIGVGAVTGIVAVILLCGYAHYRNKTRVELSLPVAKMREAEAPLKIVAVSDLHLGYGIGRKEFEGWVERINRENPDIVLMAGDIIDNNLVPVREERMEEVFRTIRAKYGVYAAPGNHEYISGIDNSLRFLSDAGVQVLRDSAALVDGRFYIVGRDDRSNAHRKSLTALLTPLDRSKPVIALDHQPYALEEVEAAGVDLQVSGHTHRGQVWPINLVTDALYEDSYGYLKKGGSHIYVSSGLGIWGGKFRIGSRSEYVVITLQPES